MVKRKITWSGRGHAHQLYNATFHQGPHKVARARPHKHPFSNPGPRRQGRPRAHFSFHHVMETNQAGSDTQRNHEAHLIPGVDGERRFGFPNSIITKLRYCEYKVLTGTTGARGLNVYNANGIFDPDQTGSGHQPLYRDEYAAIYDNYVVLGSKITVTYLPRTASECTLVGIAGDNDSTSTSTIETLMEQSNAVSAGMGPPGAPVVTLAATFEPLRDVGIAAKDDGAVLTSVGANPGDTWTYCVWAAAANGTSTVNVDIKVEVDYTVKFSQLKTPVQS